MTRTRTRQYTENCTAAQVQEYVNWVIASRLQTRTTYPLLKALVKAQAITPEHFRAAMRQHFKTQIEGKHRPHMRSIHNDRRHSESAAELRANTQ